jgi:EAL domain-containing protein (putative c-di-GMP-specific phosphodiesterase class I)/GGDEF domain-containing protein
VQVQSTGFNRLDDPVVASIVVHTRRLPSSSPQPTARPTTAAGVMAELEPVSESVPISVGRGRVPAGSAARDAFLRAVDEAIGFASSPGSTGFAVLMIEFDRARMLLGNYGQQMVEQIMDQAGRRLASALGPGDAYCALEAGQFAVLLQGAGSRERSEALANRVQQALLRRYHIDDEAITLGVIAGIATSERRYTQAEHVLRDAALAATRARAPGRKGRAIFQTKMRVEDTKYMALVSALHGALQGGQLRVYYQPLVSLATRTLSGFEALVRWQHPERGLLLPVEFIRAAEETGLIAAMDRWVMREAARQMAQWNAMFAPSPPLHVSVNLSASQVGDETEEHVERVLRESGLAPQQLRLEVTESSVLENPEAMLGRMGRFKELGVKLCLDDFGTGYASFSHLCELPYDTLKIDQSFVARLGEGTGNAEIVNAIIVLAHNLRMDVVAEGVETPMQAAQLRSLWCETAQGFFFSRPIDPEAAGALIASNPHW